MGVRTAYIIEEGRNRIDTSKASNSPLDLIASFYIARLGSFRGLNRRSFSCSGLSETDKGAIC